MSNIYMYIGNINNNNFIPLNFEAVVSPNVVFNWNVFCVSRPLIVMKTVALAVRTAWRC